MTNSLKLSEKYPYIWAYGKLQGWTEELIEYELTKAHEFKAPSTTIEMETIFRHPVGYKTIDEVDELTQRRIKHLATIRFSLPRNERVSFIF